MKYILPIIAAFVLLACKTTDVVKYEYRSSTMLGTRTITVTQDSVVTDFNGRIGSNRTARATTPQEWKELEASVKGLNLKEINDLPAPTNKRSTDAAPFGMVKLSTADSTYHSSSFDGFDSHAKLLPLMAIFQKIAKN